MSRQVTSAVQTGDLDSVVINCDLADFTCAITGQILFDPVVTHCGQHIERSASAKLQRCPCCNERDTKFNDSSAFFKTALQKMIQQYRLHNDVYFDLEGFKQVVAKGKLNTPQGVRFLTLLQNAPSHLNTKEVIRTETQVTHPAYLEIPEVNVTETQGKSPIEILAETIEGRDLLRKKLRITSASATVTSGSDEYFFGNAKISAESLQIQINGKTIREWLSITTAMELALNEEQEARQAIDAEAQTTYRQLQTQFRLFLSRSARGAAATGDRIQSDAVNPILQLVVFGEEGKVKAALEAVKSNATQLSALLSNTGTAIDYSDRTITGMTLLQAAAAAGDIEMCQMLKSYMDANEFNNQLAELFPEGIEAYEAKQQQDAFNFDAILATIAAANTTDLDAALSKQNNGSALCRELDVFRDQFKQVAQTEKIFNPYHLLRACEAYSTLWDQCERDGSDRDYQKRDLFWRQIIGYVQRFVPACYAQAFVQGLWDLVKVGGYQGSDWRPKALERNLKFKYDPGSYFSADSSSSRSVCPGLGFDFAIYAGGGGVRRGCGLWRCGAIRFFQKLLSSKNIKLSEHYATSSSAGTRAFV